MAQSGEGDQELSLLSEEQRDLSESLPRLSGSAKSASRESKSIKMRLKRAAFKEARKPGSCRHQPPSELKMMNSKDVPNNVVQDKNIPMVIIGTDVVSLYPNLRWDTAGEQVYQAIMKARLVQKYLFFKFKNALWLIQFKYIA